MSVEKVHMLGLQNHFSEDRIGEALRFGENGGYISVNRQDG